VGGYLYAGYSHQFLSNALTVSNAIESIHSLGAGEFSTGVVDNYLESAYCQKESITWLSGPGTTVPEAAQAPNKSCSQGNGSVGTALAQYELGLANFDVFEGDMDLQFRLYGMLNFIQVSDVEVQHLQSLATAANVDVNSLRQNGTMKVKFGLDTEFYFLDWMSAGLRFDRLQPNSKISEQNFMILSPRVTFRSKMVTHEEISIQYSRYLYQQRGCVDAAGNAVSPAADPYLTGTTYSGTAANNLPARVYCAQPSPSGVLPSGFGGTTNNQTPGTRGAPTLLPDENVVSIQASMWW